MKSIIVIALIVLFALILLCSFGGSLNAAPDTFVSFPPQQLMNDDGYKVKPYRADEVRGGNNYSEGFQQQQQQQEEQKHEQHAPVMDSVEESHHTEPETRVPVAETDEGYSNETQQAAAAGPEPIDVGASFAPF
jgi:hypothetical protein